MVPYANVLVTGAAGFIGFHLSKRLLDGGARVVGLDNLNPYYSVKLKEDRLAQLQGRTGFELRPARSGRPGGHGAAFRRTSVSTSSSTWPPRPACATRSQNPHAYVDTNLVGFINILEGCRHHGVKHLVFASSSSVYGANTRMPFSVHDNVDHPVSLYAATKKANELMAHTYSHLYGLPCTGLRFFTVYGPWGRPDMALFLFTEAILEGAADRGLQPRPHAARLHLHRRHRRGGRARDGAPARAQPRLERRPARPRHVLCPYHDLQHRQQPAGRAQRVHRHHRETCSGGKAQKEFLDMQPGDVPATYADVDDLMADVGFKPATPIREGIERFVAWYRSITAWHEAGLRSSSLAGNVRGGGMFAIDRPGRFPHSSTDRAP